MTHYYCEECRAVFPASEFAEGKTKTPGYKHYRDIHRECGSEHYMPVEEYAKELLDRYKTFDHYELHCGPGETWILRYLISEGTKTNPYFGIYKAMTYMNEKDKTLNDYILSNAESFVRFVVKYEEENQHDMARQRKTWLGIATSKYEGEIMWRYKSETEIKGEHYEAEAVAVC